jgi:hypothetical protein
VREESVVLEDQAGGPVGGPPEHVRARVVPDLRGHRDAAVGQGSKPGQGSKQGRLAGSVGSQHGQHLPGFDGEGDLQPEGEPLDDDVGGERAVGGQQAV